jgi:hypothetical protein
MTFFEACEYAQRLKEHSDDAAISAIFTGQNIADDFWDNFILVCNNKNGLAALLGVSPEKVMSWPSSIQKHKEESKTKDNPEEKSKNQIINTGDQETLEDA